MALAIGHQLLSEFFCRLLEIIWYLTYFCLLHRIDHVGHFFQRRQTFKFPLNRFEFLDRYGMQDYA